MEKRSRHVDDYESSNYISISADPAVAGRARQRRLEKAWVGGPGARFQLLFGFFGTARRMGLWDAASSAAFLSFGGAWKGVFFLFFFRLQKVTLWRGGEGRS